MNVPTHFHPLRRQPLKALYLTWQFVSTLLFRIPFWALVSIPNSWRPRPSWSFKKAFNVRLTRHFSVIQIQSGFLLGSPDHQDLEPNSQGVWVEPVPHLIKGAVQMWADVASVVPVRIPGYWLHRPGTTIDPGASPMPGEKVIYALHGGGYVQLSAHPKDITSNISRGLLEHCDSIQRVFSIEYRLSVGPPYTPANPFPAALLDALAGYHYLIHVVGFSPNDIIIEGDSAGGGLALALTRYLVEYGGEPLPSPPGALLLCSPWVDLGISHETPTSSAFTHLECDIDVTEPDGYPKWAFTGIHGLGAAERNRYISPASLNATDVHFIGFPKTLIVYGDAETLMDQIQTLVHRMRRDMGSELDVYKAKDAVHDYLVFDWFEPERTETLQAIHRWLSGLSVV